MRILVTGLNGFIGKNLRRSFSGDDHILSLTRRIDPSIITSNFYQIKGDISNPELWKDEVLEFSPECCIHLAWEGIPDFSLKNCRENLYKNLIFLEFLKEIKIKNLIVAGSCWEYGDCSGEIEEDFIPQKPSLFGLSKLSILNFLNRLSYESDLNFKWARIFFAYGPYQMSKSLIPSIRNDILNKENNILNPYAAQDFIYVDDVVNAILKLTDKRIPNGIYNIGSNQLNFVGHIANLIYSYYGEEILYPDLPEKINGFYANNQKLKYYCDFNLENNLKLGLEKTLNFLEKT
tara:strand:+ start:630 stop:1502 length:873 start_codon:yes stop_codon:yes gene_type:complete